MVDYKAILAKYKDLPGGIIEAFHAIQKEQSYLPEEVIIAAAEVFNIPVKDAYGVATFYSMFSVKPRGKNVIRICESAPCHIAGAAEVVAALEKELGIKMGETTPDGKFTLEFTECVGQCQATPVITVNGKPYGDVTPEKIPAILAEYK
jgi:NADH-quinone oxidoreductase subunit E